MISFSRLNHKLLCSIFLPSFVSFIFSSVRFLLLLLDNMSDQPSTLPGPSSASENITLIESSASPDSIAGPSSASENIPLVATSARPDSATGPSEPATSQTTTKDTTQVEDEGDKGDKVEGDGSAKKHKIYDIRCLCSRVFTCTKEELLDHLESYHNADREHVRKLVNFMIRRQKYSRIRPMGKFET